MYMYTNIVHYERALKATLYYLDNQSVFHMIKYIYIYIYLSIYDIYEKI